MNKDIEELYRHIYRPCGMTCSKPVSLREGAAYGAHVFNLNGSIIQFRTAKTTPLKMGQFVTFWKRAESGSIVPYDGQDSFDFLVVSVRLENRLGQFVFPKSILIEHRIVSNEGSEGRRALRVYPDWCVSLNKQALKTQMWQSPYFFECSYNHAVDVKRVQKLYRCDEADLETSHAR